MAGESAICAFLRAQGRKGGLASAESRRRLRDRVVAGEATLGERERYADLCAKNRENASGKRARAKKGEV